jgi:hypothetical protein
MEYPEYVNCKIPERFAFVRAPLDFNAIATLSSKASQRDVEFKYAVRKNTFAKIVRLFAEDRQGNPRVVSKAMACSSCRAKLLAVDEQNMVPAGVGNDSFG